MGWLDWLWYTKSLEGRIDEYKRERMELREKYGEAFEETYSKAEQALDLAENLADADDDPEAQLEALESMLDLASDAAGGVPLLDDYLTLLKNGCSAAIDGLENVTDYRYKRYRQIRKGMDEGGLTSSDLTILKNALPHSDAMLKRLEKRYRLERLEDRADEIEPSTSSCATCGRSRSTDKLYACENCSNEVCYYCHQPCNEDGAYACKECRDECTYDGLQYCEEHLQACSVDGKRYCSDHADDCTVGGETTCQGHLTECNGCGSPACPDHETTCDVCGLVYGDDCITNCDGCGDPFCSSCFDPAVEEEELAAPA